MQMNPNEDYSLYHIFSNGEFFRTLYKNIQNLPNTIGHIFLILQYFATKLCNFTKFRMLVQAVVMGFPISKFWLKG